MNLSRSVAGPSYRASLTRGIVVELLFPFAGIAIHLRVQSRRSFIHRSKGRNDLRWLSGRIHQGFGS